MESGDFSGVIASSLHRRYAEWGEDDPIFSDEWTHGVIIFIPDEDDTLQVHHFIGYPSEPTQADLDGLREELNTDETMDLVGKAHLCKFYKTDPKQTKLVFKAMREGTW